MSATVTSQVHFAVNGRGGSGRLEMRTGVNPRKKVEFTGRVPRISRLMALAIRFEMLLQEGAVADQAELGALGHVTRARVTQIMNLLHLAPDIQEAILFLPEVMEGRDPVTERQLRAIAGVIRWSEQRSHWSALSYERLYVT